MLHQSRVLQSREKRGGTKSKSDTLTFVLNFSLALVTGPSPGDHHLPGQQGGSMQGSCMRASYVWRWASLLHGSFSTKPSFFLVLQCRKLKYFEWNKAKPIWRQIHFIEQELLSHIVCPPTSPAGCAQSKSSAGAFRQLLAPLSHSPTHRPQISSRASDAKLFYPSKCRPVVLSWEGIVLAQNNNLLSLEGEEKRFGVADLNLCAE